MSDYTISGLQEAIELIEEAKNEILSLCVEIESARWGNTNYHAIRYNPNSGKIYATEDPSWTCSADEYFGESGVLSNVTLWSGQGWCGWPSANDGYEWEEKENGHLIGHGSTGEYELVENLEDEEIAEKINAGWIRFEVSTTPVDPDYSHMEGEIEEALAALKAAIESKIEDMQEEEE